jgi:hypothetical protein
MRMFAAATALGLGAVLIAAGAEAEGRSPALRTAPRRSAAGPTLRLTPRTLVVPRTLTSPPATTRFPMVIVQKDLREFPIAVAEHNPGDYSIRLVMPREQSQPVPDAAR